MALGGLGVHSMEVSRSPNCGMFDPLYVISLVSWGGVQLAYHL